MTDNENRKPETEQPKKRGDRSNLKSEDFACFV